MAGNQLLLPPLANSAISWSTAHRQANAFTLHKDLLAQHLSPGSSHANWQQQTAHGIFTAVRRPSHTAQHSTAKAITAVQGEKGQGAKRLGVGEGKARATTPPGLLAAPELPAGQLGSLHGKAMQHAKPWMTLAHHSCACVSCPAVNQRPKHVASHHSHPPNLFPGWVLGPSRSPSCACVNPACDRTPSTAPSPRLAP